MGTSGPGTGPRCPRAARCDRPGAVWAGLSGPHRGEPDSGRRVGGGQGGQCGFPRGGNCALPPHGSGHVRAPAAVRHQSGVARAGRQGPPGTPSRRRHRRAVATGGWKCWSSPSASARRGGTSSGRASPPHRTSTARPGQRRAGGCRCAADPRRSQRRTPAPRPGSAGFSAAWRRSGSRRGRGSSRPTFNRGVGCPHPRPRVHQCPAAAGGVVPTEPAASTAASSACGSRGAGAGRTRGFAWTTAQRQPELSAQHGAPRHPGRRCSGLGG